MEDPDALPFVDEHVSTIAAEPDVVRAALLATLDRVLSRRGAAVYARMVGCVPAVAAGPRPLAVGSTVPGFAVTAAAPDGEVVLQGRHRFSTYALVFLLEGDSHGRTLLRARTRASFPGVAGRGYRALVIGSRGHVLGTRRLLAAVRRRSETGAV